VVPSPHPRFDRDRDQVARPSQHAPGAMAISCLRQRMVSVSGNAQR
jgi:hypothetical protein